MDCEPMFPFQSVMDTVFSLIGYEFHDFKVMNSLPVLQTSCSYFPFS